jgi:hypothetical protein
MFEVTIVVAEVGAVKIYAAALEALKEKRTRGSKEDDNQFITQKWCISEFHRSPSLKSNVLFCRFFLNLTPFQTKLRVLVLCLPDFTENSNRSTPITSFLFLECMITCN